MTPAELETFKAEARARGFSHVVSLHGLIPLEEWSPYNCYGRGGDRALAELLPTPTWVAHDQAQDFDRAAPPDEIWGSLWTFLAPARAAQIIEYEAQAQQTKKRRRQ